MMEFTLGKEAARDYLARWTAVNAAEREELRRTPLETKLLQLAALMASYRALGDDPQRSLEEKAVRARWNQLRRAMLG